MSSTHQFETGKNDGPTWFSPCPKQVTSGCSFFFVELFFLDGCVFRCLSVKWGDLLMLRERVRQSGPYGLSLN